MNRREALFRMTTKKRSSPRNTNQTRGKPPAFIAFPTPRGMIGFHGVNRSPGLASSYLRTFPPRGSGFYRAFVGFTVTGIARNSHPYSHGAPLSRRARRASLRRYAGCSFVLFIIGEKEAFVKARLLGFSGISTFI